MEDGQMELRSPRGPEADVVAVIEYGRDADTYGRAADNGGVEPRAAAQHTVRAA